MSGMDSFLKCSARQSAVGAHVCATRSICCAVVYSKYTSTFWVDTAYEQKGNQTNWHTLAADHSWHGVG